MTDGAKVEESPTDRTAEALERAWHRLHVYVQEDAYFCPYTYVDFPAILICVSLQKDM